jgi:HSP20 family protein
MFKKRSFLEKLTGGIRMRTDEDLFEDDDDPTVEEEESTKESRTLSVKKVGKKLDKKDWGEEEEEETDGQLTVDVYQTPTDIVVQTMVAGVRPEDLAISITRDMITLRGRREETKSINDENYFIRELYWGTFSRTILLPEEVDIDGAEAMEKHGLLIIKLPKIDKQKQTNLRVKSL